MRRALLAFVCALLAVATLGLARETSSVLLYTRTIGQLLPDSDARARVVFIFQQEDCLNSGHLLQEWNELERATGVPVTGLVVGEGTLSDEQERFLREHGLRLPVRGITPTAAAVVGRRLGYDRTPFAMILDSENRVTGSFPGDHVVPADVVTNLTMVE